MRTHALHAGEVALATGRREQLFVLAPTSGGGGYPAQGQAGNPSSFDYLADIMGGLSMAGAPAGAAEVNAVAAVDTVHVAHVQPWEILWAPACPAAGMEDVRDADTGMTALRALLEAAVRSVPWLLGVPGMISPPAGCWTA